MGSWDLATSVSIKIAGNVGPGSECTSKRGVAWEFCVHLRRRKGPRRERRPPTIARFETWPHEPNCKRHYWKTNVNVLNVWRPITHALLVLPKLDKLSKIRQLPWHTGHLLHHGVRGNLVNFSVVFDIGLS
jgi:hypothetical protein